MIKPKSTAESKKDKRFTTIKAALKTIHSAGEQPKVFNAKLTKNGQVGNSCYDCGVGHYTDIAHHSK